MSGGRQTPIFRPWCPPVSVVIPVGLVSVVIPVGPVSVVIPVGLSAAQRWPCHVLMPQTGVMHVDDKGSNRCHSCLLQPVSQVPPAVPHSTARRRQSGKQVRDSMLITGLVQMLCQGQRWRTKQRATASTKSGKVTSQSSSDRPAIAASLRPPPSTPGGMHLALICAESPPWPAAFGTVAIPAVAGTIGMPAAAGSGAGLESSPSALGSPHRAKHAAADPTQGGPENVSAGSRYGGAAAVAVPKQAARSAPTAAAGDSCAAVRVSSHVRQARLGARQVAGSS